MRQIILDFGIIELFGRHIPLRIPGYGLMVALGFLVSIYFARRQARRAGENPDVLTNCGIIALIAGISGARIAFLIQHWNSQFAHSPNPLAAALDFTSGLTYYGGLLLGMGAVLAYLRLARLPVRRYLDILAVSLMIGLAFGRAGCLLNGCCFGAEAHEHAAIGMKFPMYSKPLIKLDGRDNPYSVHAGGATPVYEHQFETGRVQPDRQLLESDHRGDFYILPPRELNAEQVALAAQHWSRPVIPTQALGIVNALLLAVVLVAFRRLRSREGQAFALLLMLYPITRFLLELLRDDNPHDLARGILTHNQYTSIGLFLIGAAMWLCLYRLPASAGPLWAERLAAVKSAGPGAATAKRNRRSVRSR